MRNALFLARYLSILAVTGCVNIDPGGSVQIQGDITFSNLPSSVVGTYIAGQGTTGHSGNMHVERVLDTSDSASNAITDDPAGIATYSVTLPYTLTSVDENYRLVLDPLHLPAIGGVLPISLLPAQLSRNPNYRFGTNTAGADSDIICAVPPPPPPPDEETNVIATAQCPVSECAALITANLTLAIDDPSDLDAGVSALCAMDAGVEELANSNSFIAQASSGIHLVSVADLLAGTASVSMLVRGEGKRVRLEASCVVKTTAPGYANAVPLPADWTTLETSPVFLPAVDCEQVRTADIPLTLTKTAGSISGLFHVSGHELADAKVEVVTPPSFMFPTFDTDNVPAVLSGAEQEYWVIDNVPEGDGYQLVASAKLDNGMRALKTPVTNMDNGGTINVTALQQTSLHNRLIAQPYTMKGTVTLLDPAQGEEFGLTSLTARSLRESDLGASPNASYVMALGNRQPLTQPAGSYSGEAGISLAKLEGSIDTSETVLNYELAVVGHSPINVLQENGVTSVNPEALSGESARPTRWKISTVAFRLEHPDGYEQQVRLRPRFALEPAGENTRPGSVTDFGDFPVCLGHINVSFQADIDSGIQVGAPMLRQNAIAVTSASTEISPTSYDQVSQLKLQGILDFSGGQVAGTVKGALPEGIAYRPTFEVPITYQDGSDRTLYGNVSLPSSGTLTCGDSIVACVIISLDDNGLPQATQTPVINVIPSSCNQNGLVTLDIDVISGGYDIERLVVDYDDGQPQTHTLCEGDCPTGDFNHFVSLAIPDNVNQLKISAENAYCSNSVPVDLQPSQVSLSCGVDREIYVGSSASLTFSEVLDAICPANVPDCETYSVSGGCPPPPVFTTPTVFPVVDAPFTVTHSAGAESCTWQLDFNRGDVDQLAYIEEGNGNSGRSLVVRHVNGTLVFNKSFYGHEPYLLAVNSSGTGFAVADTIANHPLHLVDLDDNERDISANYPRQIAFQPGGQHLAILDVDPAGTAYRFRIVNLNLPGAFVIWGDTLDSTLAPRFDWSNDGTRLTIATGIDSDSSVYGAIRFQELSGIPLFIPPIAIGTPIVLPDVTSSYLGFVPMGSSNVNLMDVTYDNVHQLGILLATSDGIYALDADNTFSQLLDASLLQASFSELDVLAAALNIAGNNQGQANLTLFTDIGLKSFNSVGDRDPVSLSFLQQRVAVTRPDGIDIYQYHPITVAGLPEVSLNLISQIPANGPRSVIFSPARED